MSAIHPAEKSLTTILAIWTIFQPWAFGTMHVWSQSIALALAVLAFAISLYPRLVTTAEATFRVAPWRMLVRLPLFWLVLAVFGYVVVQALNPAWAFRQSATHWWIERQPHLSWLPSGIEAPFARMNGWRKIFIWASPFLAGCAIWLGITRRRTAQTLLVLFVVNAAIAGIYAIVQQAAGMKKIFWTYDFPWAAGPFGSFVYKNHGAAYLLVAFAAACGLAFAFYLRGVARGAHSTPAPVLGFLALAIATAAAFSLSRLGAVLTGFAGILLLGSSVWSALRRSSPGWWLPIVGGALLVLVGGTLIAQLDTSKIEKGLARLTQGVDDQSPKIRLYAYTLTLDMLHDYPIWGVGAGGFRHLTPAYAQSSPILVQQNMFGGGTWKSIRTYALDEAHSEPLEFAAEFGAVGGALLAAVAAFALAAITQAARRGHPLALSALIACVCLGLFACVDFPLHNPAVVSALVAFGALACRLSDLETPSS